MNLVQQMNPISTSAPSPPSDHHHHEASILNPPEILTTTSLTSSPSSDTSKLYNQYACIRCRKLKKKCSKELPRCANCERQGESCEYVERKNKRKSSISIPTSTSSVLPLTTPNPISIIKLKKPGSNSNSRKLSASSAATILAQASSMNQNTLNNPILSSPSSNDDNSDNESLDIPIDTHIHRRTISNPGKLSANLDYYYNQSSSSSKSFSLNPDPISLSPKYSNIRNTSIITLPPIRSNSNLEDTLPPLASYSLQQQQQQQQRNRRLSNNPLDNPLDKPVTDSALLPAIPKQLLFNPATTTPPITIANLNINSNSGNTSRPPSISSLSPSSSSNRRDSTFLIPSKHNDDFKSLNSDKAINSNSLFDFSPKDSIEQDLLVLIFNKIGFIDETIFVTFNNNNSDLNTKFEKTLGMILKFIIFLEQKTIFKKLNDFQNPNFNWNDNLKNSEDYFSSIEFLLIYTCAIIITNSQYGINNSNYHKSIFTMAYKLFQKKAFPISRIQILKFMMLFQIISLLGDEDLDIPWFIQSNLSKYSLKWKLNRNNKKLNLSGVTLSELEFTNRLFWCIFITDSILSSTLGQQPSFSLTDIDVPLPIPITKDEELRISIQTIIINMSKIQNRIISELYVANAKNQINTDSERFTILSSLRQDADLWYNDCRVSLSKLPSMINTKINDSKKDGKDDASNIKIETSQFNINLQNFAAWISQEYYYTLTQLFKSSNLFPRPDIPNFTVISNAAYQNTLLLHDLLLTNIIPNCSFIQYRFANTSLCILTSTYKGMFTASECKDLIEHMLNIWRNGNDDLSNACYKCILEIRSKLSSEFSTSTQLNEKLKLGENSSKALLEFIKNFTCIMEHYGFLVSVDNDYLKNCELKE